MSEYLYVINCDSKYYKIGIAADVEARLAALQTGNPSTLLVDMCFKFADAQPVERSLHQRFDEVRANGEWFVLTPEDRACISRICELLGGTWIHPSTKATADAVENAEEAESEPVRIDYDQMVRDGWRIEVTGAGQYYMWRRGSRENRESIHGGKFADLPKERQEEYLHNRDKRNGVAGS